MRNKSQTLKTSTQTNTSKYPARLPSCILFKLLFEKCARNGPVHIPRLKPNFGVFYNNTRFRRPPTLRVKITPGCTRSEITRGCAYVLVVRKNFIILNLFQTSRQRAREWSLVTCVVKSLQTRINWGHTGEFVGHIFTEMARPISLQEITAQEMTTQKTVTTMPKMSPQK